MRTFAAEMVKEQCKTVDVVVIGAGLTGLTTAYWLRRHGVNVHVVERDTRIGGQIQTRSTDEDTKNPDHTRTYIYETGPTTGSVSTPEVAELMADLAQTSGGRCLLETAPDAAKRRLIWKAGRFHELPSGPLGGLVTPLFRFADKLRILGEPWRKRGTDPDESVGSLARRRLGRSFVDYAVDPFVSGVYAGNPDKLVTRYALPKLYALEQNYGSFIRGSIQKMREPKTDRDRLATKKVFSARGGLSRITEAEASYIGLDNITLGAQHVQVQPAPDGWETTIPSSLTTLRSRYVVTTCGAYCLPDLLPFVDEERMQAIAQLTYAPVMEVNVGMPDTFGGDYLAFGGLVPTVEQELLLGVLFPSACFSGRAPRGGALFSFFIGGIRHPELLAWSDADIEALVMDGLHRMLNFPKEAKPDFISISRHQRAIPQYDAQSGRRFAAVESLQQQYRGLIIGGNLRDGIGMGHRITQAANIARQITGEISNKES